jgi:hypothetical protein
MLQVLHYEGIERDRSDFVLEGGSIHVDGEGCDGPSCLADPVMSANESPHCAPGRPGPHAHIRMTRFLSHLQDASDHGGVPAEPQSEPHPQQGGDRAAPQGAAGHQKGHLAAAGPVRRCAARCPWCCAHGAVHLLPTLRLDAWCSIKPPNAVCTHC